MNDSDPSKPKLRWYQFSLRTLLVFVLVAGVGLGWLGSKLNRVRKRQHATDNIHSVVASSC